MIDIFFDLYDLTEDIQVWNLTKIIEKIKDIMRESGWYNEQKS